MVGPRELKVLPAVEIVGGGDSRVQRGTEGHVEGDVALAGALRSRWQRPAALLALPRLIDVVDEVAPHPVRTEPPGVVRPAQLRLVLGMPRQAPQVAFAVSKLALVPVLAEPVFLEWSAELRLVPHGAVHVGGGRRQGLLAVIQGLSLAIHL